MAPNFAGIPSVYEVNGRQFVAFYGSSFEKPGRRQHRLGRRRAGVAGILRVCSAQ